MRLLLGAKGIAVDQPMVPRQGGMTPLMVAAAKGMAGTVQLLVDAGADQDAVDVDGRTALDHVARSEECRDLLTKHKHQHRHGWHPARPLSADGGACTEASLSSR